jgi:hypothetical protein
MTECAICFDIINDDNKILECCHSYHKACIDAWLNEQKNCPLCRHEVKVEIIKEYIEIPLAPPLAPAVPPTGGRYFNYIQPWQSHSSSSSSGVNYYSFALQPEQYQPSGSVNFSRIDDTVLHMVFNNDFFNDVFGNAPSNNNIANRPQPAQPVAPANVPQYVLPVNMVNEREPWFSLFD